MARAIVTGLRREGMAVDVVYDGGEALSHLALTRYDVVVLDRDLPGVHGDEICRRLAAERSPSRILMLTAAGSLTDRVEGPGHGRRRLPGQALRLPRADRPGPRPRPPRRHAAAPGARARRHQARPGQPHRVPGRAAAGPQRQGIRRPGVPARLRRAGSSPPRNCWNGSGTRRPTRSPPRSSRPCTGCGPSSATRPSSTPSARAATGSENTDARCPGLPGPAARRPTLRARMTLLYARPHLHLGHRPARRHLPARAGPAPAPVLAAGRRRACRAPSRAGHTTGILSAFVVSDAFRAAVAAVAIMAVFSLALGWLIAGRFVRPLRAIISHRPRHLRQQPAPAPGLRGRGDEFAELGETLDDLFARLEASFESQRHFIANASHELRTPLSAGRALLQVAIADPEPTVETLRATCEELVELSDQQERLIAALLTLASSQRGLGPAAAPGPRRHHPQSGAGPSARSRAPRHPPEHRARPGSGHRRPEPGGKPDRQPDRQRHPAQPARRPAPRSPPP